jgi:hypothetical protein
VIIADIAAQMGTARYKMATQADLDEPVAQVEAFDLWVPKTYATRRYSWMTPPARSCRRIRK